MTDKIISDLTSDLNKHKHALKSLAMMHDKLNAEYKAVIKAHDDKVDICKSFQKIFNDMMPEFKKRDSIIDVAHSIRDYAMQAFQAEGVFPLEFYSAVQLFDDLMKGYSKMHEEELK